MFPLNVGPKFKMYVCGGIGVWGYRGVGGGIVVYGGGSHKTRKRIRIGKERP